jgi:hypothetical protein
MFNSPKKAASVHTPTIVRPATPTSNLRDVRGRLGGDECGAMPCRRGDGPSGYAPSGLADDPGPIVEEFVGVRRRREARIAGKG